jgi:hypothetical protein
MTVVISVYKVANFPDGGGHFWVYMQYAQALRRLGCDVYWLEQFRPLQDPEQEAHLLAIFLEKMKRFGLEGKTLLYARDGQGKGHDVKKAPGAFRFIGSTWSEAQAVLRRADLLLNFHYAIDARLLACVRRSALVDIDPGLLQLWMSTGQIVVAPHDRYLTTGETVGKPTARFSDCGVQWITIRPPICLDLWPFTYDPLSEAFTTVSTWLTTDFLKVMENGKTVLRENTKRVSFLRFLELPRSTRQPLELALYLTGKDSDDRARLEEHGWRVRDSREVTGSPEAYRSYLQRSRGEFSCAKPSYVEFQGAWISDRTLCYLASGKPAIVQDTGPSAYLPNGEGLLRFTTLEDAIGALDAVNADYERHCHAARGIAEAYFDAKPIVAHILNETLGSSPPLAIQPAPPQANVPGVEATGYLDSRI